DATPLGGFRSTRVSRAKKESPPKRALRGSEDRTLKRDFDRRAQQPWILPRACLAVVGVVLLVALVGSRIRRLRRRAGPIEELGILLRGLRVVHALRDLPV